MSTGRYTTQLPDGRYILPKEYIEDVHKIENGKSTLFITGNPIDKLAEYENAEENEMLVHLPCKYGDEVWFIDEYYGIYETRIVRGVVDGIVWYKSCGFALDIIFDRPIMGHSAYKRKSMPFTMIGGKLFTNRELAEKALELIKQKERNEDAQRDFQG